MGIGRIGAGAECPSGPATMGRCIQVSAGIFLAHAVKEIPVLIVKCCMLLAEVPDLGWIVSALRGPARGFGRTAVMLAHLYVRFDRDNRGLANPNINKFGAVVEAVGHERLYMRLTGPTDKDE